MQAKHLYILVLTITVIIQIPIILWHHERILEALQRRVIDETQSVGDVLLDAVRIREKAFIVKLVH